MLVAAGALAVATLGSLANDALADVSPEPTPSPSVGLASGEQSATLETDFGGSRDSRTLTLLLKASDDGSHVRANLAGDLVRDDSGAQFPAGNISVEVKPTKSPMVSANSVALVTLVVALDPKGVEPGT